MATGGSRISLPLAVGVDRSHPQWPDLSLFFFVVRRRDKNGHWGWWDLSPLTATPSGQIYLFFFFFFLGSPEKSSEIAMGGGVCSSEVGDGWRHLSS